MNDIAGATLIAKELEIDCMKWVIKQTSEHFTIYEKPYIFALREATARILIPISDEEQNRIKTNIQEVLHVSFNVGDSITGKRLLLLSDVPVKKEKVGASSVVSGRHKRQYLRVKSRERCVVFIISTWRNENIEPPEPLDYLNKLLKQI